MEINKYGLLEKKTFYDLNKINSKYVEEAKKLLPNNNYIGFSITQGNVYRKKEWPIKNVVDICNKLKEKNITSVLVLPVGFRAKDDPMIHQKKVRKDITEIVFEMY